MHAWFLAQTLAALGALSPVPSAPAPVLPVAFLSSAPSIAPTQEVSRLQDSLRRLLSIKPLRGAKVGVKVVSLPTGAVVFGQNSGRLFDPASNEKILTTAAALEKLGPQHRFRTSLVGPLPNDDAVVDGDVFFVGSGDPSLVLRDLTALARSLAQRGVRRIAGSVVLPNAPADALLLHRNTFSVYVRPGDSAGDLPVVSTYPASSYFTVVNQARTTSRGRSRVRVRVRAKVGGTIVMVTGQIPAGANPVVVHRRPHHPASYVAWSLVTQLAMAGIIVDGGVATTTRSVEEVSKDAAELAVHESAPLDLVLHASNKDSNNYVAERIFETLGAAVYGGQPTPNKGREAVTTYLTELGLPRGSFRAMNGSGLDHINRITPDALVGVLGYLYGHPLFGAEFVQSLAVAGVDGTISKRFTNSDAVGLVRAKTGTLDRVSALSGYAGYRGRVVAFAILVERFRPRLIYEVRRAQVRMVETLMHYLKDQAGMPAGLTGSATGADMPGEPQVPMDIESTTDETVDLPQEPTSPEAVPAMPTTPAAPPAAPPLSPPATGGSRAPEPDPRGTVPVKP